MIFEDYPRLSVAGGSLGLLAYLAAALSSPFAGYALLPLTALAGGALAIGLCEVCSACPARQVGENGRHRERRPSALESPDRSPMRGARRDAFGQPREGGSRFAARLSEGRARARETAGLER